MSRLKKVYKTFIGCSKDCIKKVVPDKIYLKYAFYRYTGRKLNLKNPKTYNEKIQWLKLYYRRPEYTKLVDKYEVRKYIKKTIGDQYLIPLLGVWFKFEDINFSELPNQFVLKCTHDSGGLVICKDKDKFDAEGAKNKINEHLKRNFYYIHKEWAYKNVKKRVICEKYMFEDEMGTELKDYKIFCFNGEPKLIQVDYNRFSGHKRNLYDIEWNYIAASIKHPTDANIIIKKPKKLDEMLNLAKILSKDYPHVRVDFYYIKDKIYFGEMTFYPGAGYAKIEPLNLDLKMGNWLQLPEKGINI